MRLLSSIILLLCLSSITIVISHSCNECATPFSSFLEIRSSAPNTTQPRKIKGNIKLNGQSYKTSCNCQNAGTNDCLPPTKLKVHQEALNFKLGFDRSELRSLLGSPRQFRMMNVDKISFSCLDGRDSHAVVATPGGDFGEILNALSVVEAVTGSNLTESDILTLTKRYVEHLQGTLFHCTDEDAIAHLEANLHVNGQTNTVVGLKIDAPKKEYRDELMKDIIKPANQGDYYLKAILVDSERFYMRRALVHDAIRSLYRIIWYKSIKHDGISLANKINLSVYQGQPKEKAWINFRASRTCERAHRTPAFSPRGRVFANHPEAALVLREKLARFLLAQLPLTISHTELTTRLHRQGLRNMEVYAEVRAAASAPFYTVTVI